MSLEDRAKRAQREKASRDVEADAKRRTREGRRAKRHARRALAAVLDLSEDTLDLTAVANDAHPARRSRRPTYRAEADGHAFIVRPVTAESDFLGLGGYRVYVVIGENERRVSTLAELGAALLGG